MTYNPIRTRQTEAVQLARSLFLQYGFGHHPEPLRRLATEVFSGRVTVEEWAKEYRVHGQWVQDWAGLNDLYWREHPTEHKNLIWLPPCCPSTSQHIGFPSEVNMRSTEGRTAVKRQIEVLSGEWERDLEIAGLYIFGRLGAVRIQKVLEGRKQFVSAHEVNRWRKSGLALVELDTVERLPAGS